MRSALPLSVAIVLCSCDSGDGIPCDAASFTLYVPAERAGDVDQVLVSGQACNENPPACISENADGDCTEWWIAPDESNGQRPGTCELVVTFRCDLPAESYEIVWARPQSGQCRHLLAAEPPGQILDPEGTRCTELSSAGGAGGSAGAPNGGAGAGA